MASWEDRLRGTQFLEKGCLMTEARERKEKRGARGVINVGMCAVAEGG